MDPLRWAELAIAGRRHVADVYMYVGCVLSWFSLGAALTGERPTGAIADFMRGWGAHEAANALEAAARSWTWLSTSDVHGVMAVSLIALTGYAVFDSIRHGRSRRLDWGPEAIFFAGQYQYLTRLPSTCWILVALLLQSAPVGPLDLEMTSWGALFIFAIALVTGMTHVFRHRALTRIVSVPFMALNGYIVAAAMTFLKPVIDFAGWALEAPWNDVPSASGDQPTGAIPR